MIFPLTRFARARCIQFSVVAALSVLSVPSYSQSAGEWGVQAGYNDRYRKIGLVYQTPALWRYDFQGGWGHLDLQGEFEVSYWDAERRQPDSVWQAGATPMLRWWPNQFFYTELGVGANVFSRTHFAGKNIGSAFQFGSHVGVGTVIGGSHRIGLRYSHYSNAGIKKPNPGLDLLQLTYNYRY